MIRKALLLLAAIILVYVCYLAVRVAQERERVNAKVDRIIAASGPQNLALLPERQAMLLKVEDRTFWTNKGIDLSTPGGGMTTLSQGLGKIIFFDHFKPGFRKGELMALTRFALYPEVDKKRTLQAVVASSYFGTHQGRAVTGFADGARTWLGKPLSGLTEDEYLQLVAMNVGRVADDMDDRDLPLPVPELREPTEDALDDEVEMGDVVARLDDVGVGRHLDDVPTQAGQFRPFLGAQRRQAIEAAYEQLDWGHVAQWPPFPCACRQSLRSART